MDKQAIVVQVIQTVARIQEMSGRSTEGIGASTSPVVDLEGFDSINGEEATLTLAVSLGVELPEDFNLFVSRSRSQPSIEEVANALCRYPLRRLWPDE